MFFPCDSGRKQFMPGDLFHIRAIDDELVFRDAHRQQFPDALPGHRVEVLQPGHVALSVHGAVQDAGSIVRPRRQSKQMGSFFLV